MNINHVAPVSSGNRINFMHSIDATGLKWEDSPLGLRNMRHQVAVLFEEKQAHSVFFSVDAGGMAMYETLTADEARLLAEALLLAANHAERANAEKVAA